MSLRTLFFSTIALIVIHPEIATAQDRYSSRPPAVVSPDMAAPWVLQLGNQPGRVVRKKRAAAAPAPQPVYGRTKSGQRVLLKPGMRYRAADGSLRVVGGQTRRPDVTVQTASVAAAAPRKIMPQMDPIYLPRDIDYPTSEKPGSIVIDSANRFLYFVMPGGKARRYGVGVGKDDMGWSGVEPITRKAEWPEWIPPAEMIVRERAKGRILPARMAGGEANPLGARALYLGSTLYRIHGTNAPWTIGTQASSGCIRMRNQDVIELYDMVKVGAKVTVL